jgi:hypothetical protein
MKLRIVAQDGNAPERFEFFIELEQNRSATFGKLKTDVLVPDNKYISRAHFEVYREGSRLYVRHLSKRNPTRIFFPPREVIKVLDSSGAVSELPPGACILAGRYVFRLFDVTPDSAREGNNRSPSFAGDSSPQSRSSRLPDSASQPVSSRPNSDLSDPEVSSISSETQVVYSELTAYKANTQVLFLTEVAEENDDLGSAPSISPQPQRSDKLERPTIETPSTSSPPVRPMSDRLNSAEVKRLVVEPTSVPEETVGQLAERAAPSVGLDRSQTKSVPPVSGSAAFPTQAASASPLIKQAPETFEPVTPGLVAVPRNTVSYVTLWEFSVSSHWAIATAVSEVEVLVAAQPGIPQAQPATNRNYPEVGRSEEPPLSPAKVATQRENHWQANIGGSQQSLVDFGEGASSVLIPADESPSDQILSRCAVDEAQPPYSPPRTAVSERSQATNLPSYDEAGSTSFREPLPISNDFSRERTEKPDSLPESLVQPLDYHQISSAGEDDVIEFEPDLFEAEDDDRSDPEIFHDSFVQD